MEAQEVLDIVLLPVVLHHERRRGHYRGCVAGHSSADDRVVPHATIVVPGGAVGGMRVGSGAYLLLVPRGTKKKKKFFTHSAIGLLGNDVRYATGTHSNDGQTGSTAGGEMNDEQRRRTSVLNGNASAARPMKNASGSVKIVDAFT